MLFKRMKKQSLISNLVSIALLVVVALSIEGAVTLRSLVSWILIFSVSALALNIICGCLGEFVLGHGGFLLVGYTTAVLVGQFLYKQCGAAFYKENVYIALGQKLYVLGYGFAAIDILAAAIVTGLIGFLVGSIALGRLKGDYLAIVTLGIGLVFVNIAKNFKINDKAIFGGSDGIGISGLIGGTPLLYAIFFIITIFLILTFMKSRFGRAILACRDDNIAAEASGVAVNKTKLMAFTFATFLTGIAGAMFAHHITYEPVTFGQDRSILFLIIIVLGGLGSLTGSVLASAIIVLYEYWFCMQSWVPEFFAANPKIIYGIVLVLIMLFRSNGILGTSEFSWKWFYKQIKFVWNKIISLFKDTPKEVE